MRSLYGDDAPCPRTGSAPSTDGDAIALGEGGRSPCSTRRATPRTTSPCYDDATGAMFTGEAIGTYLPWAYLVPPRAAAARGRPRARSPTASTAMRARRPTHLLTSHFGPVPDARWPSTRPLATVRAVVRRRSAARSDAIRDADDDALTAEVRSVAADELAAAAAGRWATSSTGTTRIGSIRMNAQGLGRYWRKRRDGRRLRTAERAARRRRTRRGRGARCLRNASAASRVAAGASEDVAAHVPQPQGVVLRDVVARLRPSEVRQRLRVPAVVGERRRGDDHGLGLHLAGGRVRSRRTSSASGTASAGRPIPRRQSAITWFWSTRPVMRR